jgi:hypothetical protein
LMARKRMPWSSHGMMSLWGWFPPLITPGRDPGVLFGGREEDAMVKRWHDEFVGVVPPSHHPRT